jgi:polyphosphate kinase 2 (PPK2 family)
MKAERYRVEPGTDIDLGAWPTDQNHDYDGDKADAEAELAERNLELADLQGLLSAEGKHKLLVVLQGMDTSGKDGTIKHVFRNVNPLGVKVANFKSPNDTELAHDYLWRVHHHAPSRGHVTIFNRSHYEDVLIVRVHNLHRRGHDHSEVLPAHLEGRAEGTARGAPEQSEEAVEVRARRRRRAQALG